MIKTLLNKQAELQAKANKKEAEIEKATKLKERYEERARWIGCILRPLAKAIIEKEGLFNKFQVMGPFGLGNETSLWFWKNEEDYNIYCDRDHPKYDEWSKRLLSITFSPMSRWDDDNNYLGVYLNVLNHNENTGEYPEGSIGAINGFNKTRIDITDWDLETLIEFMYDKNKRK